jgi:hypothetical protein
MAKKRAAWEFMVYYGAAGSTAATLIPANVVDVDPGGNQDEYVDLPTRGDGATMPQQDEYPVKAACTPKVSMVYHDGDTHMAALLAAADASPRVGKALKIIRHSGGVTCRDGDFWIRYTTPGPIAEGQVVEFEFHPTSAYGRAWS